MQTSITVDRLREILEYHPSTGLCYNKKTNRVLQQDYDGLVGVFCSVQKKSFKLKLERTAYALAHGVFPRKDQKVLHRNLDTSDNRPVNLVLVSRTVFLQIKEAQKNLEGSIRITPHATDQFDFVVHWLEKAKERQKIVQDITEAKRVVLKLQLKYSKTLTKYCLFD